MDVEASRAIRQAEVGAAKTMIERTEERFGIKPERLAADTAYGSAANLNWVVNDKKIAPHIPVIDKSKREDGTFSREDFTFDKEGNVYICPAFNILTTTGKVMNDDMLFYRASTPDCAACAFKTRCCPKEPARKILRSIYEEARDVARAIAKTDAFEQSCRERKRIEMLFAHLKRILRLGRLRLRGPRGAQFEFTLAAIAQNLRRLAKLMARPPPAVACALRERQVALKLRGGRWYQRVTAAAPTGASGSKRPAADIQKNSAADHAHLHGDFCNKIGTDLPTSALQRFRPELGDQQTVSGRAREDRT